MTRPKDVKVKDIRCPSCNVVNNIDWFSEEWEGHTIDFTVDRAGTRETEGILNDKGNPVRVRAYCKCGHKWHLRGITQITQLDRD